MPKKSISRTQKQLVAENKDLRARLDEADETMRAIRSGEVDALIISGVDGGGEQIFALKQVEEALRLSEEKYRTLVDEVNDGFYVTDSEGVFTFANTALAQIFGVEAPQALVGRRLSDSVAPEMLADHDNAYRNTMQTGRAPEIINGQIVRPDGTCAFIEIKPSMIVKGDQIVGSRGVVRDITERKLAEGRLAFQANILANISDVVYATDEQLRLTWWNHAAEKTYGWKEEDVLGKNVIEVVKSKLDPESRAKLTQELSARGAVTAEIEHRTRSGEAVLFESTTIRLRDTEGKATGFVSVNRDITERKRAEESLRNSEIKLRSLFAAMLDVIIVYDADGRYLEIAPTNPTNLYRPPDEMLGRTVTELFPPDQAGFFLEHIRQTIKIGQTQEAEYSLSFGNQVRWFSASISPLSSNSVIWVAHDITHRKAAEERIQRQFEHLAALSNIDRFIAGNFNLELSLSEILTHVTMELGIDAVDILILKSNSQTLEYGAERGFRTKAIRNAQVRLGESYAGRAALERHLVQIPNLRDEPHNLFLATPLKDEDFVCYYGVPLIAKGQVKGVLEVFHRTPLEPDPEWFDFLNALAAQAAIAIDNLTMFDDLQRSNSELMLAYETTLEGWSLALDLRDKETEGHTQRVTETTVKLARAFGLSEAELLNVRRGGLLHDIGKMGVPDNILLKPSELTEEEWKQMRMHPVYAYDMLSHIAYLHEALDIPYCHHEKWDGTGYPRGLKGEEIPISARIFAVVDVWDALSSDRPYRAAWTKEKARKHIRSLSGTHFDPHVVDAFMQVPN